MINPGPPVITTDDRTLGYSCYQDDDTAELETWVPDDEYNFPCKCDSCGLDFTWSPDS